MGYLEAMSYGSLPVLLFLIRLLLTKRMRHYPHRVGYLLLWINMLPLFLCYAFLLLGRSDLCQTIVRITTSLGIIKSMHYIFFPESKVSALKYTWCPKTEVWVKADLTLDKHKGEKFTLAFDPRFRVEFYFDLPIFISFSYNLLSLHTCILYCRSNHCISHRLRSHSPYPQCTGSSSGIRYGLHESYWIIRYRSCCLSPP